MRTMSIQEGSKALKAMKLIKWQLPGKKRFLVCVRERRREEGGRGRERERELEYDVSGNCK